MSRITPWESAITVESPAVRRPLLLLLAAEDAGLAVLGHRVVASTMLCARSIASISALSSQASVCCVN